MTRIATPLLAGLLLWTAACADATSPAPGEPSSAGNSPGGIGTQPPLATPPATPRLPGGPFASRVRFTLAGAEHATVARPAPGEALGRAPWSYARVEEDGGVTILSFRPTGSGKGDLFALQLTKFGSRTGTELRCGLQTDGQCHGRLLRGVDPARMEGPGRWYDAHYEVVTGTVAVAEQGGAGVKGTFTVQAVDMDAFHDGREWSALPRVAFEGGEFDVAFETDAAVLAALRCVDGGAAGHGCGGAGPGEVAPGTFQAVVTGDTTATLAGPAQATASPYDDLLHAGLGNRHPGAHWESVIGFSFAHGAPVPGTYSVTDAAAIGGFALGLAPIDGGFGLALAPRDGTITVTRVTADGIEGTLDISAGGRSYDPADTKLYRVRVQARFHLAR